MSGTQGPCQGVALAQRLPGSDFVVRYETAGGRPAAAQFETARAPSREFRTVNAMNEMCGVLVVTDDDGSRLDVAGTVRAIFDGELVPKGLTLSIEPARAQRSED